MSGAALVVESVIEVGRSIGGALGGECDELDCGLRTADTYLGTLLAGERGLPSGSDPQPAVRSQRLEPAPLRQLEDLQPAGALFEDEEAAADGVQGEGGRDVDAGEHGVGRRPG